MIVMIVRQNVKQFFARCLCHGKRTHLGDIIVHVAVDLVCLARRHRKRVHDHKRDTGDREEEQYILRRTEKKFRKQDI